MPSLREIRQKIKSVKSTQQITKAMKMVAAARLRRAQARILAARPFAQKMEELMTHVVERRTEHPLFVQRPGTRRILLLVTADKGLCGAFNTNLIREALRYLRQHRSDQVQLYVVGRKGRDYFKRIGGPVVKEYANIFNTLNFAHAEIITRDLVEAYERQPVAAVDILYNEFKSVIQQRLVVKPLLPITTPGVRPERHTNGRSPAGPVAGGSDPNTELSPAWPDFEYEPAKEQLLEGLVPRFLKAQVFRVLLESAAAELGARMAAMDNATKNASELMGSLTLRMNRTRQASITKEILEVVSGAEALK